MKTFTKKNFALVMGIALPIVIVVFFLLASALPRLFIAAPRMIFCLLIKGMTMTRGMIQR